MKSNTMYALGLVGMGLLGGSGGGDNNVSTAIVTKRRLALTT